jgi:Asp-tRNA(Asn)/Glu-tRNA(Gln) amidotransferase A subunit family amidase
VGLQITGRPGEDALVLAAAKTFQHKTDFHLRRPPV